MTTASIEHRLRRMAVRTAILAAMAVVLAGLLFVQKVRTEHHFREQRTACICCSDENEVDRATR